MPSSRDTKKDRGFTNWNELAKKENYFSALGLGNSDKDISIIKGLHKESITQLWEWIQLYSTDTALNPYLYITPHSNVVEALENRVLEHGPEGVKEAEVALKKLANLHNGDWATYKKAWLKVHSPAAMDEKQAATIDPAARDQVEALLKEGKTNFSKPKLKLNLAGADLSGLDLSRVRFDGMDLSRANFSSATLHGAHLTGANMDGAIFDENTKLSRETSFDGVENAKKAIGLRECLDMHGVEKAIIAKIFKEKPVQNLVKRAPSITVAASRHTIKKPDGKNTDERDYGRRIYETEYYPKGGLAAPTQALVVTAPKENQGSAHADLAAKTNDTIDDLLRDKNEEVPNPEKKMPFSKILAKEAEAARPSIGPQLGEAQTTIESTIARILAECKTTGQRHLVEQAIKRTVRDALHSDNVAEKRGKGRRDR